MLAAKSDFPALSAYVASKHALEGYSESLSLEVQPFGIDIVLIEPGSYQTNIWSAVDSISISECITLSNLYDLTSTSNGI